MLKKPSLKEMATEKDAKEIKTKFSKKVAEKRAGKTDTGSPAEVFNPEPEIRTLH